MQEYIFFVPYKTYLNYCYIDMPEDMEIKNVFKEVIKNNKLTFIFEFNKYSLVVKAYICGDWVILEYIANDLLIGRLKIKGEDIEEENCDELFLKNENTFFILILRTFCLFKYYQILNVNLIGHSSKLVKVIEEKNGDKSLKIKNLNLTFKSIHSISKDRLYDIYQGIDKVIVSVNNLTRPTYKFPSELYPMPNNKKIRVFTSENTEDIKNDYVNEKLSGILFKTGMCYSNSTQITELLGKDYIFYSGWLLYKGQPIHHAWVVKDNSVIDVGIFKEEDEIDKVTNKEDYADRIVELLKCDEPFKSKYHYGKVNKSRIYIGVPSDRVEAITSFNNLLDKYNDHPDYLNCDKKTGSNETLRLIYDKLNNTKKRLISPFLSF